MLCYVIWRWVPHCDRFVHVMFMFMLRYVMLCYVKLCYVMLCYVMLFEDECHIVIGLCMLWLCLCYVMLCYVVLFEDECHIVIGLCIRELWVNESQVDITRFCDVNTFNQRFFSPACLKHRHYICLSLCCLFYDFVINWDSLSSTYWRINELWIRINTEGSGRDFSCRTDAQILGTTKSLRLNFVRWRLICLHPQYGTCFTAPLWFLWFWVRY